MKWLSLLAVLLLVLFALLFALGAHLGFTDEAWLEARFQAWHARPYGDLLAALFVSGLLALDLFLPVPASVLMALSGSYFGVWLGAALSFIGAMASAGIGYGLCRWGGQSAFTRFVGEAEGREAKAWFERYGVYAIILSRPVPMLTEILSCLAGVSGMDPRVFFAACVCGTLPVCLVYAFLGAQGAVWAVWASLGLPALAWLVAMLAFRQTQAG